MREVKSLRDSTTILLSLSDLKSIWCSKRKGRRRKHDTHLHLSPEKVLILGHGRRLYVFHGYIYGGSLAASGHRLPSF